MKHMIVVLDHLLLEYACSIRSLEALLGHITANNVITVVVLLKDEQLLYGLMTVELDG